MLYGGHSGVAVCMYKLEYAYTLTTRVYVYIFFGGYLAYPVLTVYLYRLVVWGYTNISNMYMC